MPANRSEDRHPDDNPPVPEPPPDDRPDSVFETDLDVLGRHETEPEILDFGNLDAAALGPSRVRLELMAFEEAITRVHPGARKALEEHLRGEFREVRAFKP